ncbi:YceG-like family protein [Anoxybacillus vitaminiphilus]|uniref:YceG-like family protein n=1 Tax=Paranoxybacillus vitaminiphilus TaxID=581036 RepID=A0A327YQ26_9BACL|nr:endolytic transglycosylase MltG [Anoxybacillus vitaminiphilus]RAK22396.1 YceG-like family protein [Anoxybacillus vitaminiphilus]
MDKTAIRAFAIGMLLATAVIGSIYYYSKPAELTETEIYSYLQKKGLIAISEKEYNQLKEAKQQSQAISANKQVKPAQKNMDKPKTIYSYQLVIDKGKTAAEIAKELEDAKVIKDAAAFIKYLKDHDLTRKIREGTYHVNSNMNHEELSKMMTKSRTNQ